MDRGQSIEDTGDVYENITISGGVVGAIGGRGHRIEQTVGREAETGAGTAETQGSRPPTAAPAGDLAAIRDLLLESFDAAGLRRLLTFAAQAELQPAIHEFAEGDGLAVMVDKAIRFCQSRGLLTELLAEVEQARPRQHAAYRERARGGSETE